MRAKYNIVINKCESFRYNHIYKSYNLFIESKLRAYFSIKRKHEMSIVLGLKKTVYLF
jgi:hypothetical protein